MCLSRVAVDSLINHQAVFFSRRFPLGFSSFNLDAVAVSCHPPSSASEDLHPLQTSFSSPQPQDVKALSADARTRLDTDKTVFWCV